ncbi:MAG: energy transducer TonB [Cyclobacteriaceae bacterium]
MEVYKGYKFRWLEEKKFARADLSRYKSLIFSASLLLTMLMVLAAFEWKQYDRDEVTLQSRQMDRFDEVMDIPPTEIPPPPPPAVVTTPRIVEIPDEQEIEEEIHINLDVDVTEQTRVQEVVIQAVIPDEEEKYDEIFVVVEQPATPKGGIEGFYDFVRSQLHYPAQARRMQIEGKVFVEFVIDKDGSLSDVKVVKGIGAGCDEEAMRVVAMAPRWNPAKQRGKTVRQRMVLPITFKMVNMNQ